MIFNFSKQNKFSTRLQVNNEVIENVHEIKLLGTTVTDKINWDKNTENLVKKANKRLRMLTTISKFNPSLEDKKQVYISFVRSILEQSCVVWGGGLNLKNIEDLERVQKSAVKIILNRKYVDYEHGLNCLNMNKLSDRREELALRFAKNCIKNNKFNEFFQKYS